MFFLSSFILVLHTYIIYFFGMSKKSPDQSKRKKGKELMISCVFSSLFFFCILPVSFYSRPLRMHSEYVNKAFICSSSCVVYVPNKTKQTSNFLHMINLPLVSYFSDIISFSLADSFPLNDE